MTFIDKHEGVIRKARAGCFAYERDGQTFKHSKGDEDAVPARRTKAQEKRSKRRNCLIAPALAHYPAQEGRAPKVYVYMSDFRQGHRNGEWNGSKNGHFACLLVLTSADGPVRQRLARPLARRSTWRSRVL